MEDPIGLFGDMDVAFIARGLLSDFAWVCRYIEWRFNGALRPKRLKSGHTAQKCRLGLAARTYVRKSDTNCGKFTPHPGRVAATSRGPYSINGLAQEIKR